MTQMRKKRTSIRSQLLIPMTRTEETEMICPPKLPEKAPPSDLPQIPNLKTKTVEDKTERMVEQRMVLPMTQTAKPMNGLEVGMMMTKRAKI